MTDSNFLHSVTDWMIDVVMNGRDGLERDALVHRMERRLATECAVDRIARYWTIKQAGDRYVCFAPPSHYQNSDVHAKYADSVRYLDLLGLVEKHPDHPDWILVEKEA